MLEPLSSENIIANTEMIAPNSIVPNPVERILPNKHIGRKKSFSEIDLDIEIPEPEKIEMRRVNIPSSHQITPPTEHPIRHNLDMIDLEKPWNLMIKQRLKNIGEKAMGYRWMHNTEVTCFTRYEKILKRIEIIILAIMGTFNGSSFATFISDTGIRNSQLASSIMLGFQLLLFMVYCGVKGIRESGDYPNRIISHRFASNKFNDIYIDIQNQLTVRIDEREKDTHYLLNKSKEYNETMLTSPSIRPITSNAYIEATKGHDLYKPLLVGGFDQIQVVSDDTIAYKPKSDENELNYEITRWLSNF